LFHDYFSQNLSFFFAESLPFIIGVIRSGALTQIVEDLSFFAFKR